jgi:DNA-binding NarL/FixJ family response regulator
MNTRGCTEDPVRVAVVEDKLNFRRGLSALFELTPGIRCVGMYATAEEALRQIPIVRPQVVLMDLNLPGLSGIECTRELRRIWPETQVVILTIEDDDDRMFAALRAGATGYLLKTAMPGEIIDAIQLVQQGGSPMSAAVARRVVVSFHRSQPAGTADREALSVREAQVLDRISRGKRVKEIAAELGVSVTTVQTYLRRIYEKLQVNSQAEAVAKYFRPPPPSLPAR